jgi:hypothetical protein
MDAGSVFAGGIGWSPWLKWDSSLDRRAISEQFHRTLLKHGAPLESLLAVEAVTPDESSSKSREKGVKKVKITTVTEVVQTVATSKGV